MDEATRKYAEEVLGLCVQGHLVNGPCCALCRMALPAESVQYSHWRFCSEKCIEVFRGPTPRG